MADADNKKPAALARSGALETVRVSSERLDISPAYALMQRAARYPHLPQGERQPEVLP